MNFANIYTNSIVNKLPSYITKEGATIQGPSIDELSSVGWRKIDSIDNASKGCRATSFSIQEIDKYLCKLIVTSEVNVAEEQATALANEKLQAKSIADTDIVIKSLCLLILQEINTLRQKAGLSQYTALQFKNALANKIDLLS